MSKRRYSPGPIRTTVDNLPAGSGDLPSNPIDRTIGLEIISLKDGEFMLTAQGGKNDFFPPGRSWTATLPITQTDLFGHVDDCNNAWSRMVVYYKPYPSVDHKPFLKTWDHPVDEATFRSMGARLARAGDRLFFHLFRKHEDPKLRRIVRHLEDASRQQELILTVTADEFFAPWSMLYVHPEAGERLAADGSNFRWEGFWGYRHCIEHNPDDIDLTPCVHPNDQGRIPTSVNVDEEIDGRLKVACIAPQLAFFKKHRRLAVTVRKDKPSLEADFIRPPFPYRIVYFCCHGATSNQAWAPNQKRPWIRLTDRTDIGASDLSYWLEGRDLESRPLIFINACQGGQMHSMYYKSIASEFLEKKAIGLLGAHVDIPAVFAQQYAERFFARLLDDAATVRPRVGQLVRALTRTLIDDHLNPIGLGYSLYRGMDCTVDWTPRP